MTSRHDLNWQIGAWTVNPSLHRIDGPGGSFGMTPKALATLLCLAEHQGEVVSRQTLFDTVWSGSVVSDDTLNRAISDLRHLFGDSAKQPRVIETIRQRGYRLLPPAYPIEPEAPRSTIAREVAPVKNRFAWIVSGVLCLGLVGSSLDHLKRDGPAPVYRAVPLTTAQGFEFDVALSFDGEQVAFIGASDETRQMDLYVKRVGVETPQQLTDGRRIEISPGWSPDGRSVAFLAGDRPNGPCGLYVIQLPGGDEHRLADCKSLHVTGVSWSPDGKLIAFSDRESRDEPYRIYLLDVASRAVTALTDPPDDLFGDFSATFSPDGRSVGFVRGTVPGTTALILVPAVGDIHTIELGTHRQTRLTFDSQEIPHIDWTQDGEHIVFASHRERGTPGLWKVPAKGGDPSWLMGGDTFVRKPMLARHTKRLVYEQWDNDVSIWQVNVDSISSGGSTAKPLIQSTHFDATPQYSPDGTRLAFTSQRSGVAEIWVSDADGNRPIQLTSFGGPFTTAPRWSPDGTRMAFETRVEGQAEVYVVDLTGGPPLRLTHDPAQDVVPSWSPDGKWIYFGSNRGGDWQVWRISARGGTPTRVTSEGGFYANAVTSPKHKLLYYTRIDEPGIFATPLDGGKEELVVRDLQSDDWGNWVAGASGIHFFRRSTRQLAFYDYDDGTITDLGTLQDIPVGMIGLSLSVDQNAIAFVRQRFSSADLWMVDNFE